MSTSDVDTGSFRRFEAAKIDRSFRPRAAETTHFLSVADEGILFDAREGRLLVLDRLAALVWQCFDGTAALTEIAADLADGFGAPPATVETDLLALARSVGAAGLLDGVDADASGMDETGSTEAPRRDPRFVGPPPNG